MALLSVPACSRRRRWLPVIMAQRLFTERTAVGGRSMLSSLSSVFLQAEGITKSTMSEIKRIMLRVPGKTLEYFRKSYDPLVVLRKTIPLFIFFVISLFLSFSYPSWAVKNIAVIDPIVEENVDPSVRMPLTEKLIETLINHDEYRVLDRTDTALVLEEQKFQLSAMVRTDEAREVGRYLGADLICVSKISLVGRTYFVSVKIINVEEGTIVRQATEEDTGGIQVLLPLIERVANKLRHDASKRIAEKTDYVFEDPAPDAAHQNRRKHGKISFSFQTAPEMAVKKDYRYTMKSQIGIYGEAYLNVDITSKFFAQAGLGYGRYGPSGAGSDWVIYRGFTVFYYGAGAGMYLPDFTLFGFIPFDPAFALRGFFDYGSYLYTDIYYFYPAIELELFTTVGRFWDDFVHLRVGLPMSWNFQRDLEVFFSTGISLHGVLYLPALSIN